MMTCFTIQNHHATASEVAFADERQQVVALVVVPLVAPVSPRNAGAVLTAAAVVRLAHVPVAVGQVLADHPALSVCPLPVTLLKRVRHANPRALPRLGIHGP